jgi:hypothetical protein
MARPPQLDRVSRLQHSSSWKHRFWFALHTRNVLTARWLFEFTRRIPCGGCRRHWREVVASNPPPLNASPARTFAWTVRVHNEINKLLGKPIVDLRTAKRLWSSNKE